MTGDDINLLSSAGFPLYKGGQRHSTNPSYTFEAKTTDYASRFRLVYSICGDANGDNETFAYVSNGNIIVNGRGTLQVIDILGRQHYAKELSTANCQLSTNNFPAGVYMLRLVNGESVKVQKVVVK